VAETPIRGRWTIWVDRHNRPCDSMRHDAHAVEACPVPDEVAIERGAKAIEDAWPGWFPDAYRTMALAVLRAALDPDARPETPEERHHRELHDGTLNEMPPEERHA
jgi:hypothetical protein